MGIAGDSDGKAKGVKLKLAPPRLPSKIICWGGSMKPIFESPEVFEAYAMIDFHNLMLVELAKVEKRSPIEAMVDEATGYDKEVEKLRVTAAIDSINEIIRCKKIVEADFSAEERLLEKINEAFPKPIAGEETESEVTEWPTHSSRKRMIILEQLA